MINEYNREDVQRERKGRKRAYWIMVAAVVACVFLWRDSAVKGERLAAAKAIIASQQSSLQVQEMQAHATATLLRKEQALGGAMEAQSMSRAEQIEHWKSEAQRLSRQVSVEQGKRGPMQRKINEQQDHICHLEELARAKGVRLFVNEKCRPST